MHDDCSIRVYINFKLNTSYYASITFGAFDYAKIMLA